MLRDDAPPGTRVVDREFDRRARRETDPPHNLPQVPNFKLRHGTPTRGQGALGKICYAGKATFRIK